MKLKKCKCKCGCKRLDLESVCGICKTGYCMMVPNFLK